MKFLPETPNSYMARMWMARGAIEFDPKVDAWRYPLNTAFHYRDDETQEDLDHYVERLPLVVPGLQVVKAMLHRGRLNRGSVQGDVWFTWSLEAMWARIREVFDEYGVADERLAYEVCSGKVEPRNGQPMLPGVVIPEGRTLRTVDVSSVRMGVVSSAWTPWGLHRIDSGFCQRITHPDRGGLEAVPFGRRCVVGNEWWLVGSRGDSEEMLSLEIQASPLDDRTQSNLLLNLRTRD